MPELITSPSNPKIKTLLALQQKSSARRERGLFVVEGQRELQHCIDAGFTVDTVFVCGSLFGSAPRQNFASLIPPTASQRVPPVHEATGGHASRRQSVLPTSTSRRIACLTAIVGCPAAAAGKRPLGGKPVAGSGCGRLSIGAAPHTEPLQPPAGEAAAEAAPFMRNAVIVKVFLIQRILQEARIDLLISGIPIL